MNAWLSQWNFHMNHVVFWYILLTFDRCNSWSMHACMCSSSCVIFSISNSLLNHVSDCSSRWIAGMASALAFFHFLLSLFRWRSYRFCSRNRGIIPFFVRPDSMRLSVLHIFCNVVQTIKCWEIFHCWCTFFRLLFWINLILITSWFLGWIIFTMYSCKHLYTPEVRKYHSSLHMTFLPY